MPWVDGHIQVRHARLLWDSACPRRISVYERLTLLTGEQPLRARRQAQYRAAKNSYDIHAAAEIVLELVKGSTYEALVRTVIEANPLNVIVAHPHPAFENGYQDGNPTQGVTNALPFAFAEFLATRLGGQVDEKIEQIARIGRTKMDRWERFLYQPSFHGDVTPGAHYIIVDDVVTLGATFASLRNHIVGGGGIVCAVTALAHKDGAHQPFPIEDGTIAELRDLYGSEFFAVWKESFGHDVQSLTQPEGLFLSEWGRDRERDGCDRGNALLQRVRARIDQAASQGRAGESARGNQSGGGHN